MTFWHGFILITGVHILGAMSPGPDFVFISQQTLAQGRRIGLISSLGVALGLGIHITYSVLGMAAIIASAPKPKAKSPKSAPPKPPPNPPKPRW